jgi:rhodanese-related sulfurtransferase
MSARLLLLAALNLVACGADDAPPATNAPAAAAPAAAATPAPAPAPAAVDAAGLKAAMDGGAIHLVDVRTTGEFAGGHAPGAINIPLDQLESRLSELEPQKGDTIYLICASGRRSAAAQELLASKGFSSPVNVTGGTNGWKAAGYPVE